jgi:hypothetical protein
MNSGTEPELSVGFMFVFGCFIVLFFDIIVHAKK